MAERREPLTLRLTPTARTKIETDYAHVHHVDLAVVLRAMLSVASKHSDEVHALLKSAVRL